MKHTYKTYAFIFIGLLISFTAIADLSGDWEAELSVNDLKLPLIIHLKNEQGSQSGSLDSPAQGAMNLPMTMLEYDDKNITFELASIGIHYEGQLDSGSGAIKGTFIQGGVFELEFHRPKSKKSTASDSNLNSDLVGDWGGVIQIPANPLKLIIHVSQSAEGNLIAEADSPDQGATGLTVDSISINQGQVKFSMKRLAAEFEGYLNSDKQSIDGTFKQQGFEFKLKLKKNDTEATVFIRPQEPKEPVNYYVEEVLFANQQADIKLAGTLTRPQNEKAIKAAAVLITGSGPQDRDETIFNHKPFWVIADHLTQRGYAVLRLDDRGVGDSTGDFSSATSEDFVTDISAAVDYLQSRTDIPKEKIGLIGHSEGGMIAPMLASQRNDLAFLILLAGPGVPIVELFAEQKYLVALSQGGDAQLLQEKKQQDLLLHKKLAELANSEHFVTEAKEVLADLFSEQLNNPEQLEQMVDSTLAQYNTPWFRYFLAFDPKPYLQQVTVPVLALNGSSDVQVASESNLNGIKEALKASGNSDVTIKSLVDLNHMFQQSQTGSVLEYARLTETFSPTALQEISGWLNQRYE